MINNSDFVTPPTINQRESSSNCDPYDHIFSNVNTIKPKKRRNTDPLAVNWKDKRYQAESQHKRHYLVKNNPALNSSAEKTRIFNVRSKNGKENLENYWRKFHVHNCLPIPENV